MHIYKISPESTNSNATKDFVSRKKDDKLKTEKVISIGTNSFRTICIFYNIKACI